MSFFADLVAGALGGAGEGMVREADVRDREARELQLARERAQAQRDLQTQRDQDRADREEFNLRLRAELAGAGGLGGGGSRSRGGGGGGGSGLESMLLDAQGATTPAQRGNVIDFIRMRAGDDAADLAARRYGMPGSQVEVNPTAGDFARFDREQTDVLPSTTRAERSVDAERGRQALNRLLAQASGKSKDFADAESTNLRTDAVAAAMRTGSDAEMRRAGAASMALEGKDRFGEGGGTIYDKSGVSGAETTAVGKSQINENNAQAAKYGAEAKNEREGGGKKADRLDDMRKSIADSLRIAQSELSTLRRTPPKGMDALDEKVMAEYRAKAQAAEQRVTQLEGEAAEVRRNLMAASTRGGAAAPPPAPAAAPKPAAQRKPLASFAR